MAIHPTIEAATLSMWDTMILMIMALVVFGPRRLPKIGRQIGKLMYEFRKASNDFRFQMEEELRNAEDADRRQREEAERQRSLAAVAAQPPAQIEAQVPSAELPAISTTERPEEYTESDNGDYRSSYDDSAYEDYQRGAQAVERESEPGQLSVKAPETGAPVPAERPTSRASVPPAIQEETASTVQPSAEPGIPEFLPSGDEAAHTRPQSLNAQTPSSQIPPANESATETEPAAHHG